MRSSIVIAVTVALVLASFTAGVSAQAGPTLVTFNDLTNPNRPLNGVYPTGIINWGTNLWYLSSPWLAMNTNSIGFNGAGPTSATFTFVSPRQVLEFDALSGNGTSTVTVTCNGTMSRQIPAGGIIHVVTGLLGTCTTVTMTSSNGWNTNFDSLLVSDPGSGPTATPTPSGPTNTPTPMPGAETFGSWSAVSPIPLVPVSLAVLPDGRLLMTDEEPQQPVVYNPFNLQSLVVGLASNLFCSTPTMLPDGRVLVVGGHGSSHLGTHDANIFDYATNSWQSRATMTYERWYPSATLLGDGRVLVLSGMIQNMQWADVPEVYNPASNTWQTVSDVSTSDVHEIEYPLTMLLPDGSTVTIAVTNAHVDRLTLSPNVWTRLADTPILNGSAAHYRPGKLLMTGGGVRNASSSTQAATVDFNQSASWQSVAPMHYPRFDHNLTVLPDGNVMAIGGAPSVTEYINTGTLPTEIWNPDTNVWTTMDSVHEPRLYHSSSALLPDGRVVVGGGGSLLPNIDHPNLEYFSPPYLFKGVRPTISSAPPTAGYGQTFQVTSPDAATLAKASLIPLAAVTHTSDMNQRYLELPFTTNGTTLTLTAPAGPNLAPPGNYMLFVLNNQGVPSTAAIVRLGGTASTATPTSLPTNTPTSTPTAAPSATPTASPTATMTPTPTDTPTSLPTCEVWRRKAGVEAWVTIDPSMQASLYAAICG